MYFAGLFASLLDYMVTLVCAVIGAFLGFALPIITGILSIVPDAWSVKLGSGLTAGFKAWLWVDEYLPLSETVALFFAYLTWLLAIRVAAWAMALIRG